jgi:hypothetical protein
MHYSDDDLIRLLRSCKSVKGAVTFNVPVDLKGHIPEETAAQLVRIGQAMTTPSRR